MSKEREALEENTLRWHALNYRTAPTQNAQVMFEALEKFVEAAIKQALAQPKQEPVAWANPHGMDEGLFDNVPLMNKERDKAWEQLIKRKDVPNMFTDTKFGFPLNSGFYDLWCIAWAKAWDAGFKAGLENT